jgi:iron transport multicopper oxidase
MSSTKASSAMMSVTSEFTDSSTTDVKPPSSWQDTSTSSWFTVTAVTSSISSVRSTTTFYSIATSASYPATNSSVSDTSASPSKTGTALTSHASSTTGNTMTYDWNIEWMIAAPDGFARPVIGVNGQWYVQFSAQTQYMLD